MKQPLIVPDITLEKFVHGGQVLGHLPDGKSVFVWGGLPGEQVDLRILKQKSSYAEAIVSAVSKKSSDRVEPAEPQIYLSTSPWQILSWQAENRAKQDILSECFQREGLEIMWADFQSGSGQGSPELHYRNKMEFGFFGDEEGLHLAHYVRGSHGKQITTGSVLAMAPINAAAQAIATELNRLKLWGGDLKTITLRCSQAGETVGALFIKKDSLDLSSFKMPKVLKGLDIYYSNPKSPASVPTKKVLSFGSTELEDTLLGKPLRYSVLSFFQVNLPIFTRVLERINELTKKSAKIDLYSGVGSIGIALSGTDVLVESDTDNIRMAQQNAQGTKLQVIQAASEHALTYIDAQHTIIVDPPRAGLHADLVKRLLEVVPPKIVYLSCNPATQARDVKLLSEKYAVSWAEGYNFFPRTPHIESLLVLERKPEAGA